MSLYKFTVEEIRSATLWVEADNAEDALVDAEALAEEMEAGDWDDIETDVVGGIRAELPTEKVVVWTGGAGGHERLYDPAVTA